MRSIQIEEKYDNKPLISVLSNIYPSLKISSIHKALRKKDIKVNGKRVNENVKVRNRWCHYSLYCW